MTKKVVKSFLVIALIAVFMTLLVGCGGDSIDGTWRHSSFHDEFLEFSGNSITWRWDGSEPLTGRFNIVNSFQIEITWPGETPYVYDFERSQNVIWIEDMGRFYRQ
jgi:hypothetical protein